MAISIGDMKKNLFSILVSFVCLIGAVKAGEITPELQSQISTANKDQLIRVWIKLPRTETPEQLKLSVNAASATREGRYAEAYNRLKAAHLNSQKGLKSALNQWLLSGKCTNVKYSWLANVVEAEIAAGELESLASRSDIEIISTVPILTSIKPSLPPGAQESESALAGVEPNLTYIKAPQAWAAGFTGAGRVICSFDTGVEGDHPALMNSWKGLDGDSAAAWFDPSQGSSFPNPVLDEHGTHVMGIMVGHNDATGDTVGVALDAKWISVAVVDITGASYIDAFEWAANPDSDPNSVDDVPDVINHSWGIKGIGCQNVFYDLIDNLEALGIVNIFAAGNDGLGGASTIRNPANGADDSLDCFAVGSVNTGNPPAVSASSSRGPSDCNGAIKPNVCAPGLSIRTTNLSGGYSFSSGTSMATPHVSGLAALLRQKNPNATVDQIKTAILNSTQFRPTPINNNIGWGVIDCMAALNALSGTNSVPNVRLHSFDHSTILPGTSVGGKLVLQNLGASVTPLTATIVGSNPAIAVVDGSASFGAIASNDTLRSTDSIRVNIVDTVSAGTILSMNLRITNGSTYTDTVKLYFLVEPPNERSFVTHDLGLIDFSVSNFGTYGLGAGSFFPTGGAGFVFNPGSNSMFECGLMIGTDSAHISDGIRNAVGEPDGDFRVTPGGNIAINMSGAGTSQKTKSRFNDSRAENPLGINVRQLTYAFAEPNLDDFIIMRYIITNSNPFFVSDIYVGLYVDWDIDAFTYFLNAGGYDFTGQLAWMAYYDGSAFSLYRGAAVLDGTPAGAFTSPANMVYYQGGDGFTEREKDSSLGAGFSSAATYANVQLDLFQVISAGPLDLNAGQSGIVTFALLAGNNLSDLRNAAGAATTVNDTLLNSCCLELRGNVNNDGVNANILDLNYMVNDIFRGGPSSPCPQEADLNADGGISTILDLNYLVNFIFRGGNDPFPCPGY